jgi:hypothetical protein
MPATEPVAEKLDPDTAVTVTVLSSPIELYSQSSRSKQTDPFAYLAPFETNRMGAKELFLWVSTPQAQGALTQPQVLCNGQAVELKPLAQDGAGVAEAGKGGDFGGVGADGKAIKVDLSKLSLSRAPYEAPVPWRGLKGWCCRLRRLMGVRRSSPQRAVGRVWLRWMRLSGGN